MWRFGLLFTIDEIPVYKVENLASEQVELHIERTTISVLTPDMVG